MYQSSQPLTVIRGIGEARKKAFANLSIHTIEDLLHHLPRDFHDFSVAIPVAALEHGKMAAVQARVLSEPKLSRFRGMTLVSVDVSDGMNKLRLKWFNQPYRKQQLHPGETKIFCGRVDLTHGKVLQNPQISDTLPGLLPIYPVCRGLSQRIVRDAVRAALQLRADSIVDPLPETIRTDFDLCPLKEALFSVHFPSEKTQLQRGRRRLAFENMLYYLLAVEMQRKTRKRSIGISFDPCGVREKLLEKLSFPLTGAQQRVFDEIDADMECTVPMNRLLQGDVGSGKTVVALYALCIAAANGYQGVLLAPTDLLARQHYDSLYPIFKNALCLLTGNMKKSSRESALTALKNGTVSVAVGTHALLEEDVHFHNLGLVVTDEQHRFGVSQRAKLEQKGIHPDVLVMSATPIPRTLAMLLYGDLDVSVIDELPPGRKTIKTSYIPSHRRKDMYDYVAAQAALGLQSYIVCPFIEPTEGMEGPSAAEVFQNLQAEYPAVRFGLLHGRMPQQKKDAVMESFRSGETQVLVSTTVIEVGVHVENACIMIIEGAERFGLAQLHQLRGRVGRGNEQAYCFLLSDHSGEQTLARLSTLTESNDGFHIAEKDLQQRGPGEFLGTRQHGDGDMQMIHAAGSMELLAQAKQAAALVLDLPTVQNNLLIEESMRRYCAQSQKIAMN